MTMIRRQSRQSPFGAAFQDLPRVTNSITSITQKQFVCNRYSSLLVLISEAHGRQWRPAGRPGREICGPWKKIVLSFLTDILGFPNDRAAAEACRWEHVISHDAADRLLDFLHFSSRIEQQRELVEHFHAFHRKSLGEDAGPTETPPAGKAEILRFEPESNHDLAME